MEVFPALLMIFDPWPKVHVYEVLGSRAGWPCWSLVSRRLRVCMLGAVLVGYGLWSPRGESPRGESPRGPLVCVWLTRDLAHGVNAWLV